jgi:hypothetical protein
MTKELKKEWDFIIKETHEVDKENRIKREVLFVMQCELSKLNPNICLYNELKDKYLIYDYN